MTTERKSIAIYAYFLNLSGLKKSWQHVVDLTWSEYEQYAKTHAGEGINWKAELI